MHEIQIKILKNLVFNPQSKFSELKKDMETIDNNQFCFHLNSLINQNLVEKREDNKYQLTKEGLALSEKIDTESNTIKQQAKLTVYLGAVNQKKEILIYTRKKSPFFNCQGFGGGRINYGEDILNAAKREFKEETGLIGEPELIKILHNKLYDRATKKLTVDKIMFFFKFNNPTGNLVCSDEGLYEWVSVDTLEEYIQKPFDSKEEFLKQVKYLLNWDGEITLEEQEELVDNY